MHFYYFYNFFDNFYIFMTISKLHLKFTVVIHFQLSVNCYLLFFFFSRGNFQWEMLFLFFCVVAAWQCLAYSLIQGVLTIYHQASGLGVIPASKFSESHSQVIYLKPGINTLVLVTFKSYWRRLVKWKLFYVFPQIF